MNKYQKDNIKDKSKLNILTTKYPFGLVVLSPTTTAQINFIIIKNYTYSENK